MKFIAVIFNVNKKFYPIGKRVSLDRHTNNKELISALRLAMYDFSESSVRKVLDGLFISEPVLRLCYPLGDKVGVDNFTWMFLHHFFGLYLI